MIAYPLFAFINYLRSGGEAALRLSAPTPHIRRGAGCVAKTAEA
jgi:hypothetical protein